MKHIHVVYIITKLELGGAQKVCLTLFNDLKQHAIKTTLISGNNGILVDSVSNKSDVFLISELDREVTSIFKEIVCFYKLIKIIRALRLQDPHIIVHTHSTKAGLIGRWAAWLAGAKYRIHTIHGYAFHSYQHPCIKYSIIFLEWITSFITTHFICVSSKDVKTGMKIFSTFSARHTIIRAAVAWDQFYIPSRVCTFSDKQPFVFGTTACFKKQKNIFDLLLAFKWTYEHNSNVKLEIIGDGPLRPALVDWIDQHKLNHVITLHGWQQQVAPYMHHWHCFVLSSLWEGLPCAIIEARLLKLPVLSYNTGGISEVIIHGHNGMLCAQRDWKTLALNMLTISQEHTLHSSLSSYKDNLNDFRSTVMVNDHITLYRSLHKRNIIC